MKQLTLGVLAHVDAGKTTLSEAMLFLGGTIRKMGRVDNRDAFLDTNQMERERGITIFSKQAVLNYKETVINLLDTPGHADFSAEMERTLQVLDLAVLVISAADGVQGHTRTLWKLLERYQVPVFLFINKMDQPGTDRKRLLEELAAELSGNCVDFTSHDSSDEEEKGIFYENLAMCEEELLNRFLNDGRLEDTLIREGIGARKIFPCFFGSALRVEGVEELMQGMVRYAPRPDYPKELGARVFKISRDDQGMRLTHMKITGGCLKNRMQLEGGIVNQIRIYSGEKYKSVTEAEAGSVCAVTGLSGILPGEGIGFEKENRPPVLEPVLRYALQLPRGVDPAQILPELMKFQEEDPTLHILWEEETREIFVMVMGEVQIEVLKRLFQERLQKEITFGAGRIVYKETIADRVEGIGHFEPLRHYAEVHLLLEPGDAGSGLTIAADCSEDLLAGNWQRLILTHLREKIHRGVLIGAPVTDIKITLVSGKAHLKHTEGGDFRQATYRAVRQGLMQASSVLLEPVYAFRLEVPGECVGRAMTDMDKLHADFRLEEQGGQRAVLTGRAPVETMQHYSVELAAYTRGQGILTCSPAGYAPCHNAQEIVAQRNYDPEADLRNPTGSVFCAHGAGFVVPWDQVRDHMHLPSCLDQSRESLQQAFFDEELERRKKAALSREEKKEAGGGEIWIGTDEIAAILGRTAQNGGRGEGGIRREGWKRERRESVPVPAKTRVYKGQPGRDTYLLVDGYNIIFAWDELKELAGENLDGARGKLLDILCDYQGMQKMNLIVVFDAYRLQGHKTETLDYHNIHVVYTKTAETADKFIEKFAHENAARYDITVATSDGLEQIIIRGQGCKLLSARDLREEIERSRNTLQETYLKRQEKDKTYLGEYLPAFPEDIDDLDQQ